MRPSPASGGATLVELERGKLERHGEGHEKLRELFDGPGAWSGILESFEKVIAAKHAGE